MNLLEYEGKSLLAQWGIPIPKGIHVVSPQEAVEAFNYMGASAVLKIQVPIGGRGKAGGVKIVNSEDEVETFFDTWNEKEFKGYSISGILVQEDVHIESEAYISITINSGSGNMLLMFCPEGGMDIEEIAQKRPESLLKMELEAGRQYREFHFRIALSQLGMENTKLIHMSKIAHKLYKCFVDNDLCLAEINPLVIKEDGEVLALDAKIEVDDSALFRNKGFNSVKREIKDVFEREAKDIGVTYVKLEGNIGIIASGAGLAMNTMDIISQTGYQAANFLETGGGITSTLMSRTLQLIVKNESVKAVIVNLYGGVNPLVEAAKGLVDGLNSLEKKIPIIVKALGNQQEECWSILEQANIPVIKNHRTEDAVKQIIKLLEDDN